MEKKSILVFYLFCFPQENEYIVLYTGSEVFEQKGLGKQEQSDQGLNYLQFCLHLFSVHYSIVKPHYSNFRIIEAIFLMSKFFRFFKY